MTSVRASRPTARAHERMVATSVAATAGSEEVEEPEWGAPGSSATRAGRRPGPSRSGSRQAVGEPREISPTRSSAGERPKRLTRSALEKIGGGPTLDRLPIGGTASHDARVELTAAAKKDLSSARWLTEKLRRSASFAAYATWLD